jgi:hypothetical protein
VVDVDPIEDGEAEEAAQAQTHGEKPTEDKVIPRGKYADRKLSEVCKDDPAYAREHFLNASPPLGPVCADWLVYWTGSERGGVDDFANCTF